jgi:hypothetical protein
MQQAENLYIFLVFSVSCLFTCLCSVSSPWSVCAFSVQVLIIFKKMFVNKMRQDSSVTEKLCLIGTHKLNLSSLFQKEVPDNLKMTQSTS